MAATIQCSDSVKEDITAFLLQEIGDLMESIREEEDVVSVEETDTGLEVDFPCGEIYGYSSDYVQVMPRIFQKLKETYPDIAIYGIAYEYETITAYTFGSFFYCSAQDSTVTVTYDWQECAACGNILEGELFYNSSQQDFEEGNLLCLCCPTCMLAYVLDKEYGEVQPNASLEEELEEINGSEDPDTALKEVLWKRICDNLEEYLDDFAAHREKITALASDPALDPDKKAVLVQILERISG